LLSGPPSAKATSACLRASHPLSFSLSLLFTAASAFLFVSHHGQHVAAMCGAQMATWLLVHCCPLLPLCCCSPVFPLCFAAWCQPCPTASASAALATHTTHCVCPQHAHGNPTVPAPCSNDQTTQNWMLYADNKQSHPRKENDTSCNRGSKGNESIDIAPKP